FIIKGAVAAIAVFASHRHSQPVQKVYILLAEAVMVFGYFVTEWVILGFGLATATAGILGNVLQGLSGVAIWALLIPVANRIRKQPQ
ncbi:MAG: ECF transporter S component, partial [Firmicutes bacterium]|nr:ECF transporter S component [Bacillota bacterium]